MPSKPPRPNKLKGLKPTSEVTMLKIFTLLIVAISALIALPVCAFGQDDSPTYVLASAFEIPDVDDPNDTGIEIEFGKNFPKDETAPPTSALTPCPNPGGSLCYAAQAGSTFAPDKWIVRAVSLQNGTSTIVRVQSVEVFPSPQKTVNLFLSSVVDTNSFKYVITYAQANIPIVTLGQPKKSEAKKIFTAAKGKTDADIYFKGSATAARKSGPVYSIEARFSYLQSLRRAGAIGGTFTFVSDEGSKVDPDSITAAGSYEKIFVLGPSTGIILRSDFIGGEFDKKNKTQNLTTGLETTLVLPSKRLGETTFATVDFTAGFDAGHNYKHELNPNGLGNFWRPKVGVNAYLLALNTPLFNRISLNSEYKLRLPQSAEPFTERINGENITSLTKRPRHYFGTDLNLLFTSAYGITISYRYGSLPPAFKLVDHKVSIGFTLQLKQANK
jgi:hypothetical protein